MTVGSKIEASKTMSYISKFDPPTAARTKYSHRPIAKTTLANVYKLGKQAAAHKE
ncbi:hypothetical protein EJ02DRAFT_86824 [Clathrospora elynae]|uniref:Uncharacterized protein n=1 Tax=Clathrospora elynae TaxID=706981 RepID=A0A6A5S9H4_9PLEO|nr:hypothetical protein EJ02DRAFT_86824 [Clathrospora elynae]